MSKLITRIKRSALALCLATPVVSWAATTYSTDHTVTGSETAYTSSAGNANVTWQNFNFRAAVDKDHLAHGYYFFLKDGDTDIGETDAAVKLDSITLTWGNNTDAFGADDTPYLVVTTPDESPVIIAVSNAGDKRVANGTSTFTFSNVVLASNAKYRFYFYKNDVSGLSVGDVLTGQVQARINGRYHNTSGDARADYNDIRCSGGAGYSINCSFVVSPLEEGDAVVLETGDASIPLAAADTPVVVEGKVVDGAVDVGSEVAVDGVLTVCGEATTLVLTDSLTATAFYFPATVTIDASAVSGLDPTGDDSSKTTTLLSGALKYMTAPTVVLPAATAGMIYETNVTASGISVTVVKGVDCVETITENTSWSTIKPQGWIDSIVGDKPAISITYEGSEPVTLTFDETVQAGSLTLNGNIVVEASAAATFGTVNAGAGSVVEMANMTITTQSGSGVYRYRSDYPSTVPNNSLTYEYVGTADPENPGTVNLNGMHGTVRTTGYMSITGYFPLVTNAKLDVVSGTTTLTAGGQAICGYITIREGATLVNTATDSLAYSSYNSTIDIYGTLDMGTSRWSTWSGAAINLRGGEVVGAGEGNNGAIDLIGTGNVTAYADSTISANIKFRNALSNVTVNDGVTLTISGATKPGFDGGGITKKGNGTLKFTSDPYVPGGIVVEDGTLAFDTESDVDPVVTYTASVLNSENMDYAVSNNWKGTVIVSAVAAGNDLTQVALKKTGNESSYLTLNGISGNAWCADSNYTVQPAITLAGDVNFQNGYSNKAVTFRKIAAGTGNLSLKSWSNCTGITYGFTTLDADNYTGTIQLDGSVLTFNVGNILKAGAAGGDKVLPLTVANNATVNLSNAKLNGEAADLEVKEDGIYVVVPTVTIMVPEVPNTTVTVANGGETIGTAAGNYEVAPGSVVTVTYAAASGYAISGTTKYTIDTSKSETTFEVTDTTTAQYVARVRNYGTNKNEDFTSLNAAIAVADGTTYANNITLLTDIADAVTIDKLIYLAGQGKTISAAVTISSGGYLLLMGPTLTGKLTIGANGAFAQVGTGSVLPEVETQDGASIALSTLSADTVALTVTTLTVNGTLTLSSTAQGTERGTPYKAFSYVTANATFGEGAEIVGGGVYSASTEVEGDNTVVSMTITAVAKIGDVYYDDLDEAVADAIANDTVVELPFIQPEAAVTLGVGQTLKVKAYSYTLEVNLASGLTNPPYSISSEIDIDTTITTYTVNAAFAKIGNTTYPTLAAAIEAATSGDTVTLLADVTLNSTLTLPAGKTLTMDLGGFTIYSGNDSSKRIVVNGTVTMTNGVVDGQTTVYDPDNGTAMIRVNGSLTLGANLTIRNTINAVAAFGTGSLTVNGATINALGFAISTNGSATGDNASNGTVLAINSGTITSTDVAVYLPSGTMTINGGTITGSTGVYAKGGSLSVPSTSTAVITGNGAKAEWSFNGNGANSTGDALVIDNSAYPYGPATATIAGGTYESTNGDAIGNYTKNAETLPTATGFVSGGTFSSDVSAFCATGYAATETSTGVWTVAKSGINPTDPTSTQEVTPTAEEIEAAGSAEAAAIAKATVKVPDGVSGVDAATYKTYFTLSATETSSGSGVYEVAIVELNEDVVFPTSESDDLTADLADVLDVDAGAEVAIKTAKPGLYYSIEAANSVDFTTGKVEGARELATTTTVSPAKPAKTGTAVFYRVKVSATPNTNN